MKWRGGLTVEEGAMMMTAELMKVPFGRRWRWQWRGRHQQWRRRWDGGNHHCDGNGNGNGDGNGDGNGNGNSVSGSSSGDDDGGDKEGNEDESKPGLGEGSALLTRRTKEAAPITAALQAV